MASETNTGKRDKEIIPVITAAAHGGLGDVTAAVNLARQFIENGRTPRTHISATAKDQFNEIASPPLLENIEEFNESREDEDFVAVNPVTDVLPTKKRKKTDWHIKIREYDPKHRNYSASQFNPNKLVLEPGLGFEESMYDVQPGIYHDAELEQLLEETQEEPQNELLARREDLLEDLWPNIMPEDSEFRDLEYITESQWSFVYKSKPGDLETFFDIYEEAEPRVEDDIYLFTVDTDHTEVINKAERREWSRYDITDRHLVHGNARESNLTIIETGRINNNEFKRLNLLSDSLSLVTGDHSFSQAMQQVGTSMSAPFLYQCAKWKRHLASNIVDYMKETDRESAEMFAGYIRESVDLHPFDVGSSDIDQLSRLVTDEGVIEAYEEAVDNVEEYFLKDRREVGIEQAELLWSVNDTVSYIIERMEASDTVAEIYQPLLPDPDHLEDPPSEVFPNLAPTQETESVYGDDNWNNWL